MALSKKKKVSKKVEAEAPDFGDKPKAKDADVKKPELGGEKPKPRYNQVGTNNQSRVEHKEEE